MKQNLRRPRKPRRIKGGAKVRAVCENSERKKSCMRYVQTVKNPERKELA
jgi:hypothetical protein